MAVFTLPSFNVVFKIIKDSFGAPKNTTRRAVMDKYHFVFVRDRVGRLADAQEFEHLEFPRRCFPDELLDYLLRVAGGDRSGRGRPGDRPPSLHRAPGDPAQPLPAGRGRRRGAGGGHRLRQCDQGSGCGGYLHRGHAAEELRRDPERAGDLLRLRRALPALRVPLPPYPPAYLDRRTSSRPSPGSTWASRTSSRRSSGPSWCRRAGCARLSSRRTAICSTLDSGRGCSGGWPRARWWTSFPTGERRGCSGTRERRD